MRALLKRWLKKMQTKWKNRAPDGGIREASMSLEREGGDV